jgi:hypothetical protein
MSSQYNIKENDYMENKFKVGDRVQIVTGAIYLNSNKEVPSAIAKAEAVVRTVKDNSCVIARAETGPVLGEIANDNLKIVYGNNIAVIEPYYIQAVDAKIPLYNSPNKNSGIIRRLDMFELLTIVDEKNDFGKIKKGAGWVELAKVQKIEL